MKLNTKIVSKALVVMAITAGTLSAPSAKAVMVGLSYNPSMTMPSSGTGGGINLMGFGVDFFFGNRVGLEIGASYQNQLEGGIVNPNIHAPVMFRAWLGNVVGFGIGGFLDYTLSGAVAGQTALNYGLESVLGVYFPAGKVKLFVEGGYALGLAQTLPGGGTESSVQMKVGVKFGSSK